MHWRTSWAPSHHHSGCPCPNTVHHNLTLCLSSSFQKHWHSWNSLPHNVPCPHFLLLPIFSWTKLISSIWAPESTSVSVFFTQCWQVTLEQMPSAHHFLGEALRNLATLCFEEKSLCPWIAWETVNDYRNNYGDPKPSLWAGRVPGEFIPSCQRQDLVCCQMLRGLVKSLLWCLPWRMGSHGR